MDAIIAVSPIDGRYKKTTEQLKMYFSEFALIKHRTIVEIKWLLFLLSPETEKPLSGLLSPPLSEPERRAIEAIAVSFSVEDALRVKELEVVTNHDVKAVEYFIREKLIAATDEEAGLRASTARTASVLPLVHLACTSEDINNAAYALMLKSYIEGDFRAQFGGFLAKMRDLTKETAAVPLLALTHGQPASPTTFGKELAVFGNRLEKLFLKIVDLSLEVKFNGATGTYAAFSMVKPEIDWIEVTKSFVEHELGLKFNLFSTQIGNHDSVVEFCGLFSHLSSILNGLARDLWMYISRGVLKLKIVATETGSSVMPHKVNPIDFENTEGNLSIAIALFNNLSLKLPISRLQRDLSDSSSLRSLGEAVGHFRIALQSLIKGLGKISVDEERTQKELKSDFSVLTEALQTRLRMRGDSRAYEKLKELTRGKGVLNKESYMQLVRALNLAEDAQVVGLEPQSYVGVAEEIALMWVRSGHHQELAPRAPRESFHVTEE